MQLVLHCLGIFPSERINLLLSRRPKSQQRRPGALLALRGPRGQRGRPLPLRNPFLGSRHTQTRGRPRPGRRAPGPGGKQLWLGAGQGPSARHPRAPLPPHRVSQSRNTSTCTHPRTGARKGVLLAPSFRNFARGGGGVERRSERSKPTRDPSAKLRRPALGRRRLWANTPRAGGTSLWG